MSRERRSLGRRREPAAAEVRCSVWPVLQGPGGGLLAEPAREESPSSRSIRRCVAIASRSACSLVRCGATVRRRVSPVAGALVVFAAPPSTDSVVPVAMDACVAAPSGVWTVAGGDVLRWSEAEAKTAHLKEKLKKLKRQMRWLRKMEAELKTQPDSNCR